MLSGREVRLPVHNADFKLVEIDRLKSSCLFEFEAAGLHPHPTDCGVGFVFPRQYSASSSMVSSRKLTGRNPSLQEIMADFGFFIQPS